MAQTIRAQIFFMDHPFIVSTINSWIGAYSFSWRFPADFFQQPPAATLNISRANGNAVSGGAQHVGGPLAGAQGAGGVPQGALQQPSQPPQPIPSMAIPLTPAGEFPTSLPSFHILLLLRNLWNILLWRYSSLHRSSWTKIFLLINYFFLFLKSPQFFSDIRFLVSTNFHRRTPQSSFWFCFRNKK